MAKATVWFSASGYGSDESDAAEIASAHGGKVCDYGNGEWVVTTGGGEEIARWELA